MKCFLINIGHICTSIYVDIQSMSTVCDIYTQSELWTCEYYRRFDEYCQKKKKKKSQYRVPRQSSSLKPKNKPPCYRYDTMGYYRLIKILYSIMCQETGTRIRFRYSYCSIALYRYWARYQQYEVYGIRLSGSDVIYNAGIDYMHYMWMFIYTLSRAWMTIQHNTNTHTTY